MPFGRVTFIGFDVNNKGDWLMADVNGLVHTWGVMIAAVAALTAIVYGVTGIMLLAPLAPIVNLIKGQGGGRVFAALIAATFVPPFVLVFVLRRNFSVMGPRRQFRYICRWF